MSPDAVQLQEDALGFVIKEETSLASMSINFTQLEKNRMQIGG